MNELAVLFIAAAMVICVGIYADAKNDMEAAKNGLQQCVVESHVIWQKECK